MVMSNKFEGKTSWKASCDNSIIKIKWKTMTDYVHINCTEQFICWKHRHNKALIKLFVYRRNRLIVISPSSGNFNMSSMRQKKEQILLSHRSISFVLRVVMWGQRSVQIYCRHIYYYPIWITSTSPDVGPKVGFEIFMFVWDKHDSTSSIIFRTIMHEPV